MEIKIGNKIISRKSSVFIIAEAGVNHNGKLDLALGLVDAASEAGADAVKFQAFKAEQVVVAGTGMAEYQKKNTGKKEGQLEMLKKLEFDEKWYPQVLKRCKEKGIIFLSTPHGGFASVDLLKDKVLAFKFGSGDLNNSPVLQHAARLKKPMIISTGMGSPKEIKEAVSVISKAGNNQIIILHCVTNYPAEFSEINLRVLQSLMKSFKFPVGYSDHTLGAEASLAAVSLGSSIIEKHLTLNKNLPGPDHICSLDPKEFKQMVVGIRKIEKSLGSDKKKISKSEIDISKIVRKSIVTTRDIKRGEIFNPGNIGIKRPGTGLSPRHYFTILSRTSKRDIKIDTLINKKDFE